MKKMSQIISKLVILTVPMLLACSEARYYGATNHSFEFEIDTTSNGNIKAIVPRCKGTPFGPMIEINDSLDILTSCVYGINDVNMLCLFM